MNRFAKIEALGQIGDPRAVARLVVLLQDEDERVRRAAAEALRALGRQPDRAELEVSYLLAAQKWERLVELGEVALEPLTAALHDKSWQIRRGSAQTLGQIGNSRAVAPLLATLEDDNVEVWLAAVDALDKLGWQPDRADHGLKLLSWLFGTTAEFIRRKWKISGYPVEAPFC